MKTQQTPKQMSRSRTVEEFSIPSNILENSKIKPFLQILSEPNAIQIIKDKVKNLYETEYQEIFYSILVESNSAFMKKLTKRVMTILEDNYSEDVFSLDVKNVNLKEILKIEEEAVKKEKIIPEYKKLSESYTIYQEKINIVFYMVITFLKHRISCCMFLVIYIKNMRIIFI
jgi:hypothetical protein